MLLSDLDAIDRSYNLKDKIHTTFPVGSHVRVLKKAGAFQKGALSKGSDEVYTVVDNSGWRIVIEDSDGVKSNRLYHELIPTSSNNVSSNSAERKELEVKRKFVRKQRASDLDVDAEGNIVIPEHLAVSGKRERRTPARYLE